MSRFKIAWRKELRDKVEFAQKVKNTVNDEMINMGMELVSLNIQDRTKFSPTLARGLSIYTGTVFEFYDKDLRLTCSLGGGGR